jgi:hypothetical protein
VLDLSKAGRDRPLTTLDQEQKSGSASGEARSEEIGAGRNGDSASPSLLLIRKDRTSSLKDAPQRDQHSERERGGPYYRTNVHARPPEQ